MELCTQIELKQKCRIVYKRIATCKSEQDVPLEDTSSDYGTFVDYAPWVIPKALKSFAGRDYE